MIYWKNYQGHKLDIIGKKVQIDKNIYTFDIETTSYLILDGKQLSTDKYLELDKKEQERCEFYSTMFIWQFSINDVVYYGRTWQELYDFFEKIEVFTYSKNVRKIVYVHNLSFEFQFLRNIFNFKNVLARKSHKVMKCQIEEFNFEFRCTLYMTNLKLEKIPNVYKLDVEKLTGNLDYFKIRHSDTHLTKKELKYCENDCLVVYKYILEELKQYETNKNIPLTSTGHVRRELKEKLSKNWEYKSKVKFCYNIDGHVYNLLVSAFAGGYTHANWIYTDEIIKDVSSYDFTSSYPYVMVTHKFPMTPFMKCKLKTKEQMSKNFAYLIKVRFCNLKCKYYNNFISQNKCTRINGGKYDNGRIIGAKEIEIIVTDVDFNFITKAYKYDKYEILESYFSKYDYLPKEFIDFILEKYVKKTEYKDVAGKEVEYALEKAKFNALYGMSVTNNIKDEVIFDNETGWKEVPLKNEEILSKLKYERKKGFLSFAWGVWVTAHARNNLLENVIKLDESVIYCDTDSIKVINKNFDINVINDYNKKVEEKIKKASEELKIPIENFKPKDIKGRERMLRSF